LRWVRRLRTGVARLGARQRTRCRMGRRERRPRANSPDARAAPDAASSVGGVERMTTSEVVRQLRGGQSRRAAQLRAVVLLAGFAAALYVRVLVGGTGVQTSPSAGLV